MSLTSGIGTAASGATIGTAIAPGIGTAIGAGVGGLIGLLSGGDDNGALEASQAGIDAINALEIPELDKQLLLQTYQQNGTLTPEMIQKLPLNADTKQTLVEAPADIANQKYTMDALKQLSQTGMSAQDIAQMQQMQSQIAGSTNAKTAQLLQQSQQRGQLGGGDTLAAQLMANQQGSQQGSEGAIQAAAAAANARQSALSNYGNMATQVRTQDYATQAANQANELARQRFLDTNSLGRQQANVQAQNTANLYNLQRQQTVGDTNVSTMNQEQQRQMQAKQQMFQDRLNKAAALNQGYQSKAGILSGQAAGAAQSNANMWSGLTGAATAMGNAGVFKPKPVSSMSYDEAMSNNPGVPYYDGGEIEGPEIVPGDSPENDVVNVKASAGEFMIPKSKMKDSESAKAFIDKHFNQKKEKPSKHEALLDLIADLHSKQSKEK